MAEPALVALDWGTSSLRGYLMDAAGEVLETRAAPLGVLKVAAGGFEAAFEDFCHRWFAMVSTARSLPVVAAGMVGSRQGWREAAYAPCPAAAADLARAMLHFCTAAGRDIAIVPGVVHEGAVPDVMRGEETQVMGALADDTAARLFVLPGTHSKWVWTRTGRIERFQTFMTGELFAVLSEHSILGRLMQGDAEDDAAFRRGVAFGLAHGGLLGKLFSARTLGLFERVPATGLRAYLSGLLIGAEIAEARAPAGEAAVTLIGDARLVARYRGALALAGVDAEVADDAVTPRGLWRIATASGVIRRIA